MYNIPCVPLDIAKKAALHAEYFSKKQQLTGMAYVEDGRRAEIVIKLEQKYAELDIEVSSLLMNNDHHCFTACKAYSSSRT